MVIFVSRSLKRCERGNHLKTTSGVAVALLLLFFWGIRMKRLENLYTEMCQLKNIKRCFAEVCRNTKNKRKVNKFKEYKCINIARIYVTLVSRSYVPGPYHVFTIYEPKERRIVSQNMFDKTINHLVARYILQPAIFPCLVETNVASRIDKGTKAGLDYYYNFRRICDVRYGQYYILKLDVKKFFASIDHEILKEKLKRRIKDKDALKIVFDIIDSEEHGLGIGNMTSQILAIFYLNDFDHYVTEELGIQYYVRYQDDAILFHPSKEYLKECLGKVEAFLAKEKLQLNTKTRIYNNHANFLFLGENKFHQYGRYRRIKRKLKKRFYLYQENKIDLRSFVSSLESYRTKVTNDKILKGFFVQNETTI